MVKPFLLLQFLAPQYDKQPFDRKFALAANSNLKTFSTFLKNDSIIHSFVSHFSYKIKLETSWICHIIITLCRKR